MMIKLLQSLTWLALAVGLITVGVTYGQADSPFAFSIILLPLVFWVAGERTQRNGLTNSAFILTMLLITVAALRQQNATLLIVSTLGIFCGWDLHAFGRRLDQYDDIINQATLLRFHLQTLLIIIIITLIITLIIFNATLNVGLGWSIALGIALILGFSQAVRFLRESDL